MQGDPSLYRTLVRNYVIVLSILLVVLGEVLFVMAAVQPEPHNVLVKNVDLLGNTLFQVGAIALILEAVNLRRWATEEVPAALLTNVDYLRRLSSAELLRHMKLTAEAAFPHSNEVDHTIDWVAAVLAAPARRSYKVEIKLADSPVERLRDETVQDLHPDVLCIEARCEYRTEPNNSRRAVKINGDGVIHSFLAAVPDDTLLSRRFREGGLAAADYSAWIRQVLKPTLKIEIEQHRDPITPDPQIQNPRLREGSSGRVWLEFDLTCSQLLDPGERAWITYTHRQLVNSHDAYVWTASACTYDYSFRVRGFEGYDLVPVANPASRSTVDKLDLLADEIICHGLILPESMFAFTWSRRTALPGRTFVG